MDPTEQVLAQGRTQESSFNGADYFKGLAANQQQQQINLSRQRLMLEQQQQQNENALAPLRQRAFELNNQKQGIDILKAQEEATASIETLKGDLLMSQMVSRRLADGSVATPAAMTEANAIVQHFPYAALGHTYQGFAQQFQIAQRSSQLNTQFGLPTSASEVDKATGTTVNYGEKTAPTADVQQLRYVESLKNAVIAAPTPEARVKAQSALDDARVMFKLTPPASDITKAVQTRLEEENSAASQVFDVAKQLIPFLDKGGITGVGGLISRTLDKARDVTGIGGKLAPDSATQAAAISADLRTKIIGMAHADGNLARSDKQIKSIMEGIPDVTAWTEGNATAKLKLAGVLENIGNLSRQNAKQLGKPVSPEWLKPEEIYNMYATDKITKSQMLMLKQQNGWNIVKQLHDSATAK